MNLRAERIRLHRDVAAIYREHGMGAMADIEDRIADGLERVDANGRAIDVAERDLTGAWNPLPEDPDGAATETQPPG